MIRGAPLAALALAACSQEPAPAPAPTPSATAIGATVARPAAVGSGLNANVSGLNATRSGLNTRVTDFGTLVDLETDTLFDFDSATLKPEAEANLGATAEMIRAGAPGDIAITGHTDAKGEDAYNQRLSEQRAQAVANWLKQQVGVRLRNFVVTGAGETKPVAPNAKPDGSDDPDGRAKNRRVEVLIPR